MRKKNDLFGQSIQRALLGSAWVLSSWSAAAAEPAVIQVDVDATGLSRHLLRSTLTIPVEPGELALWFPKWVPGIHGPGQQIGNLAGLSIRTAADKVISWQRDPDDLYRFRVSVPDDVDQLIVDLIKVSHSIWDMC